jgi:hypothetical protein
MSTGSSATNTWTPDDDDDDDGVEGAIVETQFETLDLDRGTVVLDVRAVRLDDDNESVSIRLTCFPSTRARARRATARPALFWPITHGSKTSFRLG